MGRYLGDLRSWRWCTYWWLKVFLGGNGGREGLQENKGLIFYFCARSVNSISYHFLFLQVFRWGQKAASGACFCRCARENRRQSQVWLFRSYSHWFWGPGSHWVLKFTHFCQWTQVSACLYLPGSGIICLCICWVGLEWVFLFSFACLFCVFLASKSGHHTCMASILMAGLFTLFLPHSFQDFLKKIYKLLLCVCVGGCWSLCVSHVWNSPRKWEAGMVFFETGFKDSCEPSHECWRPN